MSSPEGTPYLIDLLAARIAGFEPREVRLLRTAEEMGRITAAHREALSSIDTTGIEWKFAPPVAGPIASFIHHPKRQKYFLAIRNTKFFNYVCSTKTAGKILYATGLRQDVFRDDEMDFQGLELDKGRCKGHGKCNQYCPVSLQLPEDPGKPDSGCIGCQYCYFVCPERAIIFRGELGFAEEEVKQYDTMIRERA